MNQYHPEYEAREYPELNRRVTIKEYRSALLAAKKKGLCCDL